MGAKVLAVPGSLPLFAWLTLSFSASAQATWRVACGAFDNDAASTIRVVSDDLFLVAGSTGSFGSGSSDIYLIALNGLGTQQWSRAIGGNGVDVANDMLVLPDGGTMITGTTTSSGAGGYDGYLVRTDANGMVLWERTFGGSDWDFLNDIKPVDGNKYLLTGLTYSYGQVAGSAWVTLVDDEGVELWQDPVFCGEGTDGQASLPTPDGGFVCTGSISIDEGQSDAFIAKYDAASSMEWTYTYGGDSMDIGRDIVATMDGGYSVMGATRSYSEWVEAYHLKVNGQGSEEWYKHWGQVNDQEAFEHFETATGEFRSIGYTRTTGGGGADMFLLWSSSSGDYLFGTTFGGGEDDFGYGIALLPDGYLCAGSTLSDGSGGTDVFVVRAGPDGLTELQTVAESFDPLNVDGPVLTELHIHPNPSTGLFTIPPQPSAGRWSLVDASSRVWVDRPFTIWTTRLEADVPSGLYLLRLAGKDGTIATARVTILRP